MGCILMQIYYVRLATNQVGFIKFSKSKFAKKNHVSLWLAPQKSAKKCHILFEWPLFTLLLNSFGKVLFLMLAKIALKKQQ